jgi:hypothetical protein
LDAGLYKTNSARMNILIQYALPYKLAVYTDNSCYVLELVHPDSGTAVRDSLDRSLVDMNVNPELVLKTSIDKIKVSLGPVWESPFRNNRWGGIGVLRAYALPGEFTYSLNTSKSVTLKLRNRSTGAFDAMDVTIHKLDEDSIIASCRTTIDKMKKNTGITVETTEKSMPVKKNTFILECLDHGGEMVPEVVDGQPEWHCPVPGCTMVARRKPKPEQEIPKAFDSASRFNGLSGAVSKGKIHINTPVGPPIDDSVMRSYADTFYADMIAIRNKLR